jgi:hypothetical protein
LERRSRGLNRKIDDVVQAFQYRGIDLVSLVRGENDDAVEFLDPSQQRDDVRKRPDFRCERR